MASSTFNTVLYNHPFFSNTFCKYPLTLSNFNCHSLSHLPSFFPPKYDFRLNCSQLSQVKVGDKLPGEFYAASRETDHKPSKRVSSLSTLRVTQTGSRHLRSRDERVVKKSVENPVDAEVEGKNEIRSEKGKNSRNGPGFSKGMKMGSGNPPHKSRSNNGSVKASGGLKNIDKVEEKSRRNRVERESLSKVNSEIPLRVNLDMCSKTGDVMGAIKLYEWAQREGIRLGQYHYTVILYLCSSAALGIVQPAKSGSGNRTLSSLTLSKDDSFENPIKLDEEFSKSDSVSKSGSVDWTKLNTKNPINKLGGRGSKVVNISQLTNGSKVSNIQTLNENSFAKDRKTGYGDGTHLNENRNIVVNDDFKKYALQRGFDIFEKMCVEKIPMNEATLTSVARMAMSMGDGDKAFDMVKEMKPLGINPRLRSYGPALSAFCNNGEISKAFSVEKHMLDHGVYPEEPELEALLRISIDMGEAEKVYYLLHKLRTAVRQVSLSTADLIVSWFQSKEASVVGKMKLDQERIKKAMKNGGGGWHGLGWLGKGKWSVSTTNVGKDGLCQSCGEKLATIDLDPIETRDFAESVAAIATQREKSSFQKFQKWLDYYGPFEAVIDAANVGLFSQRRFTPSKVNLIANGIRPKLPTKKWPLIVLHNRRVTGRKMEEPVNKTFVEKWKNADALYATPTGSNDDWYWLYAAIKFKCLLVTNDEMRDHTFQLLGNDFFPRWKERHQVHFSFSATGPVFHMPPPCSVVIQESDRGHWHVPIASEHSYEADRKWLCITRGNSKSPVVKQESSVRVEEPQIPLLGKGSSMTRAKVEIKKQTSNQVYSRNSPQENYKNLKEIFSTAVLLSNECSLLSEIEAAEKLGGCTIDFQI